jgi:purine-cytosine permease-like protein
MADDEDEVGTETPSDPTFATAGPRRSTFTPPPASVQRAADEAGATDDDALADALAAEFTRLGSGTILLPPLAAEDAPTPTAAPEPPSTIAPEPTAPEPVDASTPGQVPPWSSAPAPDPAQAVTLESPFEPPVRRSLPDEALLTWVEEAASQPGGTLDVIEQLETQLRLREEEAREFEAWEARMQALGPDAAAVVDDARPEYPGALPSVPVPPAFPPPTPETFVAPQAAVSDWPAPVFAGEEPMPQSFAPPLEPVPEPVAPEAVAPEPVAEVPPPPLPAWDVPAPSAGWAPPPDYEPAEPEPEAPVEAAVAEPAPAPEPLPPFAPELPGEPEPAPLVEPTPLVEPEFAEPAPAFEAVIEATIEPDTDDVEVARPAEPAASAPPPLVEPPPFGGLPTHVPDPAGDVDSGAHSFDFGLGAPVPPVVPTASATAAAPTAFSFDDLLAGAPEAAAPPVAGATPPGFIDPAPVSAAVPFPTDTDSITIIDQGLDRDVEDDVDETDRITGGIVGAVAVDAAGHAVIHDHVSPPSGPISTVRIPADEQVLVDNEPVRQPVFSLERTGEEPTPLEHRVGRAARLFWLWFAANSSILSLGLGAAVFAVGMSLRQSIVAILAGVALSFIPLGLTTLAGKRSGQPTMVVSRATFGLLGNIVPALLALITRVFWGAVMLWLLGSAIAIVLVGAQLGGVLGDRMLMLISLAVAFVIAVLVAFAGYPLLARIQLVLSVVSGALVVGLIAMTAPYVDLDAALTTPDGPWLLTVTGAVLVFSFVGLVWANSGADLARYQRAGSSGASSMLWATFGATLPAFLLIGYGALLAASNAGIASGFLQSPLDTLALILPLWYPVPLIAATALSLLSGITITLYSGGFALQAMGVRVRRQVGVVIVAVLLGALALLFTFGVSGGIVELFRDAATTLAVPTAAWAGLFAAETMIRNRRFESESLVRRGGVYADVRWGNLIALLVITAIGFAFTSATIGWLSWQGYGFTLLGLPLDDALAGTDVGVLVALVLGLLVPIAFGIPAIRRQEVAKP